MAFDSSAITAIDPPQFEDGECYLSWASTAPANSSFQVYIDGLIVYTGTRPS